MVTSAEGAWRLKLTRAALEQSGGVRVNGHRGSPLQNEICCRSERDHRGTGISDVESFARSQKKGVGVTSKFLCHFALYKQALSCLIESALTSLMQVSAEGVQ